MKLLKKIRNMFEQLPSEEQDVFIRMLNNNQKGDINFSVLKHKEKEIIHNILLWRLNQRSIEKSTNPF